MNKLTNPDLVLQSVENSCPTQVLWITKGLVYRKRPYLKSKQWLDKLLQMLEQGLDVDFEVLVKNVEDFMICPPNLIGKSTFWVLKPQVKERTFTKFST